MTTAAKTFTNPLPILEKMDRDHFDGGTYYEPSTGDRCAIGELSLNALMIRDGLTLEQAEVQLSAKIPQVRGQEFTLYSMANMYSLCHIVYGLTQSELREIDKTAQQSCEYGDDDAAIRWDLEPVLDHVGKIVAANGRWH